MSNFVPPADEHPRMHLDTALPQPLFSLVGEAVDEDATDIHLDTWSDGGLLRFRVDGMVHAKESMSYEDAHRLMNQIRVAADLDIEATLEPMEGQFHWAVGGRARDVRVTVVPTAPRYVAMHLRLLTSVNEWRDADHLGLSERDMPKVCQMMQQSHGMVLAAGPTGSGKTTSLYALAGLRDLRNEVAVSIEDPAEFDLPYVRQLEVNLARGLTMEAGLRCLLRMDPDLLMVGEIRDRASAQIAAQAALSGRLVLATVHGRDVAGAIEAMHFREVPYFVLGGALRMVIAQNLVRVVCRACARSRALESYEKDLFDRVGVEPPERLRDARGCEQCRKRGYRGRTGVFEIATIDDALGPWLAEGPRQDAIRKRLAERGTRPILVDALCKAAGGITTMQEVHRLVDQTDDTVATLHEQLDRTSGPAGPDDAADQVS